jgi:transposase-like protein
MGSAPVPLTSLSEEQRAEAYARFEIVRPALEDGIYQAQIARTHQLARSTVQRWIARYREQGTPANPWLTAIEDDSSRLIVG